MLTQQRPPTLTAANCAKPASTQNKLRQIAGAHSGGRPDVAHHRAKAQLAVLKDPHTVMPDEVVSDKGRVIKRGGTTLELSYHGLNHSDSTLVMRLPKEKLLFIVDTIPVGTVPGRGT